MKRYDIILFAIVWWLAIGCFVWDLAIVILYVIELINVWF